MKKIISLILMVCMLISLSTCFAEVDVPIDKTIEAKTDITRSSLETSDNAITKESTPKEGTPKEGETKGTATQDVVTITENDDNTITYKVITSDGVILNYTSGTAIALTQDLLQQADWFVQVFNDPRAVVESWIERHMHLNIFNIDTSTDIYLHVHSSGLSMIYKDSRDLSEDDANSILATMKGKQNYFQGASETSVGWLGDNVWFLGDMCNVDGTVTLICFVGGAEIYCYASISSDEQYDALISELEKLQITAG